MWRPAEHTDEENLRWSYLRAIEWINWPQFISEPIAPVLLYFFDWLSVLRWIFLLNYFWRFVVAPRFISVAFANLGALLVRLKFLICPIMAFLIWQQGSLWIALLALLWPLVIYLIELPLTIVEGILSALLPAINKSMYIGPVRQRFMSALGYVRRSN